MKCLFELPIVFHKGLELLIATHKLFQADRATLELVYPRRKQFRTLLPSDVVDRGDCQISLAPPCWTVTAQRTTVAVGVYLVGRMALIPPAVIEAENTAGKRVIRGAGSLRFFQVDKYDSLSTPVAPVHRSAMA